MNLIYYVVDAILLCFCLYLSHRLDLIEARLKLEETLRVITNREEKKSD